MSKSKIVVSADHVEFLKQNKIFIDSQGSFEKPWLVVGKSYAFDAPVLTEKYSGHWAPGRFASLGAFTYTRSSFPSSVIVGRYCALASGISVMGTTHPMYRLSCCGFDYSKSAPFGQFLADHPSSFTPTAMPREINRMAITIEDDVWIGDDVLLARKVHIGQGAVIAARSIVTKDVPPYAIVAGSPATIRKYRFPPTMVERLLASEWTDYAFTDFGEMDTTNPTVFLEQFEAAKAAGTITPYPRQRFDLHEALNRLGASTPQS